MTKERIRNRPVPDGFVLAARMTHRTGLRRRYGVSIDVIDRWCRETGVTPVPGASGNPTWTNNLGSMTKQFDARENSRAGQAAKWMQQFWSTFRSDVRGRPLPDGFFWNCGGKVMSDDEMIAAADEKRDRDARLLRARAA